MEVFINKVRIAVMYGIVIMVEICIICAYLVIITEMYFINVKLGIRNLEKHFVVLYFRVVLHDVNVVQILVVLYVVVVVKIGSFTVVVIKVGENFGDNIDNIFFLMVMVVVFIAKMGKDLLLNVQKIIYQVGELRKVNDFLEINLGVNEDYVKPGDWVSIVNGCKGILVVILLGKGTDEVKMARYIKVVVSVNDKVVGLEIVEIKQIVIAVVKIVNMVKTEEVDFEVVN